MSITKKVSLLISAILAMVFIASTAITVVHNGSVLEQLKIDMLGKLAEGEKNEAYGIFASLNVGAKNSLQMGEMDTFQELIEDVAGIDKVKGAGLITPDGLIKYANSKDMIGREINVEIAAEVPEEAHGDWANEMFSVLQAQVAATDCLECHDEANEGDILGFLFVDFDVSNIKVERENLDALIGKEKTLGVTIGSVVALVALALSVLAVVVLLTRFMKRPLGDIEQMVREIEKGHIKARTDVTGSDEIGNIGRVVNRFADSLENDVVSPLLGLAQGDLTFNVTPVDEEDVIRGALQKLGEDLNKLMGNILEAGEAIDSRSAQVSETSYALSQGATESASSLEEMAASMQELSSKTQENASFAEKATALADTAKIRAASGDEHMQEMVMAMGEIDAAGQEINKIIKVIEDIAAQTNLLSLNAAVEAARAGQHGKGFAVVAEEVRALAQRSAKAAQETAALIEGSVAKTAQGTKIAEQTASDLAEIVEGINEVAEIVGDISRASRDQAEGFTQVSEGIAQIDQVTQTNTASAEEASSASEELAGQASTLKKVLQKFKTK